MPLVEGQPHPASPCEPADARAWLYVLVADGHEDLLKVGLTREPLQRWSAFHARWYEAFDLRHSLLVGCETRQDAQRLETALHRELAEQRCPMPLSVRVAAAGATEWYRGAYPRARRFVAQCATEGYPVVTDAHALLVAPMRAQAERLDGLLREAHQGLQEGWLTAPQGLALVNLVDGHCQFDPGLETRLPQPAWREVRRYGYSGLGCHV